MSLDEYCRQLVDVEELAAMAHVSVPELMKRWLKTCRTIKNCMFRCPPVYRDGRLVLPLPWLYLQYPETKPSDLAVPPEAWLLARGIEPLSGEELTQALQTRRHRR